MANADIDERTLVMNTEDGDQVIHQVAEMPEDAKILYSKLQILSKESSDLRVNAQFKLEQNEILQKHYLEALKPHLSSDEAIIAEDVTDEKAKGKSKK